MATVKEEKKHYRKELNILIKNLPLQIKFENPNFLLNCRKILDGIKMFIYSQFYSYGEFKIDLNDDDLKIIIRIMDRKHLKILKDNFSKKMPNLNPKDFLETIMMICKLSEQLDYINIHFMQLDYKTKIIPYKKIVDIIQKLATILKSINGYEDNGPNLDKEQINNLSKKNIPNRNMSLEDSIEILKEWSMEKILNYNYEIPSVQRVFSWTIEDIKEMINDIKDGNKDLGIFYFYKGTIIIDGQQRLQTIYLLYEILKNLEFIDNYNDFSSIEFSIKRIKSGNHWRNNFDKFKLEAKNKKGYFEPIYVLLKEMPHYRSFVFNFFNLKVNVKKILEENKSNFYFNKLNNSGKKLTSFENFFSEFLDLNSFSMYDDSITDHFKFVTKYDDSKSKLLDNVSDENPNESYIINKIFEDKEFLVFKNNLLFDKTSSSENVLNLLVNLDKINSFFTFNEIPLSEDTFFNDIQRELIIKMIFQDETTSKIKEYFFFTKICKLDINYLFENKLEIIKNDHEKSNSFVVESSYDDNKFDISWFKNYHFFNILNFLFEKGLLLLSKKELESLIKNKKIWKKIDYDSIGDKHLNFVKLNTFLFAKNFFQISNNSSLIFKETLERNLEKDNAFEFIWKNNKSFSISSFINFIKKYELNIESKINDLLLLFSQFGDIDESNFEKNKKNIFNFKKIKSLISSIFSPWLNSFANNILITSEEFKLDLKFNVASKYNFFISDLKQINDDARFYKKTFEKIVWILSKN